MVVENIMARLPLLNDLKVQPTEADFVPGFFDVDKGWTTSTRPPSGRLMGALEWAAFSREGRLTPHLEVPRWAYMTRQLTLIGLH